MKIDPIKNGIVIDHIEAGKGMEIYNLLKLEELDCTVALMSLGALGVISVASNIVPGAVSKLCALCLEEKYKEATELFSKYSQLFSALFVETNPIPVKAAMKLMGMDSGIVRLPLTEIGPDNLATLSSAMRLAGINI